MLRDKTGNALAETVHLFRRTKGLLPPEIAVSRKIKQRGGMYELTLFSPTFTKGAFIETPLQGARSNDSFFNLLPEERRTVVTVSP